MIRMELGYGCTTPLAYARGSVPIVSGDWVESGLTASYGRGSWPAIHPTEPRPQGAVDIRDAHFKRLGY